MLSRVLITAVLLFGAAHAFAQPGPPLERRIDDIRNHLQRNPPADPQQKELASFAQRYLDEAARDLARGRRFQAQRLADAADACRRPIEHLQRIAAPAPPPPPPGDPDRLRQVYFRLRLSDFFLQQIPPPAPNRLLDLARGFYEQAVKARQAGNTAASGRYTNAADDLTHALESLAQAALPDEPK